MDLNQEEMVRYARHLTLSDVGLEGQTRLKRARVLCIGAGGLGSPVTMYLAAAGVGTLGVVDADRVDVSNLQRQVLHGESDIGRLKIDSAKERLEAINPHVKVCTYDLFLDRSNALDILGDYDYVVDGTDNFPTRYLTNDACVMLGIPNVYGSIFQFEGQLSVFAPHLGGPCYRCLFPEPPPPGVVPSCAEGGVLGVLPGVIGCLQATELIKLILGQGRSMLGRLMLYDALEMQFREIRIRRDPQCPLCGEQPTITELQDYQAFCGMTRGDGPALGELEVSVMEMKAALEDPEARIQVIDVREDHEWNHGAVAGVLHLPLDQLADRVGELHRDRPLLVHCKSGARSLKAVQWLRENGFPGARSVQGGLQAWAREVDTSVKVL